MSGRIGREQPFAAANFGCYYLEADDVGVTIADDEYDWVFEWDVIPSMMRWLREQHEAHEQRLKMAKFMAAKT